HRREIPAHPKIESALAYPESFSWNDNRWSATRYSRRIDGRPRSVTSTSDRLVCVATIRADSHQLPLMARCPAIFRNQFDDKIWNRTSPFRILLRHFPPLNQ